ncbi:MAG: LysR family transcriptional regulator [Beijerinckiaceae bacterium]
MSASIEMTAFIQVVERGSFAAAANELRLTPSAISRLVGRIEDRLGVRLLNRTTRRLALTDEGSLYLARARDITAAIEAAETEVSESGATPSGRLRINTGTAFGRHQLAPVMPLFLARYPDITFEIGISDRQVNLLDDHVDVAIRTGPVLDGSLVVRKLGEARRLICASPGYITQNGMPQQPADLERHRCLAVNGYGQLASWPFLTPEGVNRLDIKPAVSCDSADVLREMALAGLGIIRMGDFLLAEPMRQGRLVEVLAEQNAPEPFPISAVMLPGRNRLPRVRVFVDFLVEQFGKGRWSA